MYGVTTLWATTYTVMTFSIKGLFVTPAQTTLGKTTFYFYAKCRDHDAKSLILLIVVLSAVMLNIVFLSVIILFVIMLSAVMLSVVAPLEV